MGCQKKLHFIIEREGDREGAQINSEIEIERDWVEKIGGQREKKREKKKYREEINKIKNNCFQKF